MKITLGQIAVTKAATPKVKAAKGAGRVAAPINANIDASQEIDMPDGRSERIVFLALLALSKQSKIDGYLDKRTGDRVHSYVVPTFKVLQDLRDGGYMDDLNDRPSMILMKLAVGGFVKQAGSKAWIPTVFDTPFVRGARSAKGGRSSAIARNIDAYLDDAVDAIDAVDSEATGTDGE